MLNQCLTTLSDISQPYLSFSKIPSPLSFFNPFSGPEWYLVRVELTVTDVNDNIPEWSMVPAPYLAVVSPEASAGSLVYKLHAQDGDEGNNGEVEYFLSDGMLFLIVFLHVLSFNILFQKKKKKSCWGRLVSDRILV